MTTENSDPVLGQKCTSVSDNGLPCQKANFLSSSGEYMEHPGGHFFASDEGWKALNEMHYDAGALLRGIPTAFHSPEECDYTGGCAWRVIERDRQQ